MFAPPLAMPYFRDRTEQFLLYGSYEFQEFGRYNFWYDRDHQKITGTACNSERESSCGEEVARIDFDAYQAMNQFILCHAFKGPGDKPHIIPVFEFLNHLPELASTLNYEMNDKGDLQAWARRDILPGEEITNSYGRRSNPELLASYGFADPPFAEPFWSVRIFTQALSKKYFPELDSDEMEIDVSLATATLKSLPLADSSQDSADVALRTLREDLGRARKVVPPFLGLVETVADHFLSWYRKDNLIARYREVLDENRRALNASLRERSVWWATGEAAKKFSREAFAETLGGLSVGAAEREAVWQEAAAADLSDPRHLGFWNSTVVRVKMSEYLCALAYKEALQVLRGELEAHEAMSESLDVAAALLRHMPEAEKQKLPTATTTATTTTRRAIAINDT
ncbi:unnamed protein product [Polarella glacialis]|uniref:SET domain-containing protein n=1 Tax=Polarella glacialis TaxID=89957 RepID=A0A813I7W2_POLGL|nr:unnamed protein product [Polarella glacialis]